MNFKKVKPSIFKILLNFLILHLPECNLDVEELFR